MNEPIDKLIFGEVAVYLMALDIDSHTRRRRECKAVSTLIKHVFGNRYVLGHEPSGAPVLRSGKNIFNNISISHNREYAALAVCPHGKFVGIDIEENRVQQLRNVARRIFTPGELRAYSATEMGLLSAWTLKEALYKAYREGALDFRNDIRLPIPPGSKAAVIKSQVFHVLAVEPYRGMMLTVVLNQSPDSGVHQE